MQDLPDQILLSVCLHLSGFSLAQLEGSCRHFRNRTMELLSGGLATVAEAAAERRIIHQDGGWRVQRRPGESYKMALETLSWLAPLPAVSCGYVHTLLLGRCNGAEQGGQLFAFGSDMLRQLGLGSGGSRGEESQTTDMLPVGAVDDIEPAPLPVARLAPGQIVSIAAGQCHSAAVTTTGQLFLWGQELGRPLENEENRFVATPRPVSSGFPSCTRVVQVAVGDVHTACVTADGELYT